jgi:polysaccharide deacetylase family protein (PEP-CTERM system associated)
MSAPVTFTLDLEDLRTSPTQELRVDRVTNEILDHLADLGVRGTVFVVGDLADTHPGLIKRVADDGHEVGLHALHHSPLPELGPERFRAETIEGRARLEDLTGQAVTGYRAPMMSIVPESAWSTDVLAELGFAYSSSVLPAASPMYGWPGLPRTPFRWPSGLVELPCPLVTVAGVHLPFLGGTYLRLLPAAVRRHGMKRSPVDAVLWTYCHPWEFDPDEAFFVYEHGGWIASRIGWLNRRRMQARVDAVLAGPVGAPLAERVRDLDPPRIVPPETPQAPRRRSVQGMLRRRNSAP